MPGYFQSLQVEPLFLSAASDQLLWREYHLSPGGRTSSVPPRLTEDRTEVYRSPEARTVVYRPDLARLHLQAEAGGWVVPSRTSDTDTGLAVTGLGRTREKFMASNRPLVPPPLLLILSEIMRASLFPYPDFRDRKHGHEAGRVGGKGGGRGGGSGLYGDFIRMKSFKA